MTTTSHYETAKTILDFIGVNFAEETASNGSPYLRFNGHNSDIVFIGQDDNVLHIDESTYNLLTKSRMTLTNPSRRLLAAILSDLAA